jgi:hypothetical protein
MQETGRLPEELVMTKLLIELVAIVVITLELVVVEDRLVIEGVEDVVRM